MISETLVPREKCNYMLLFLSLGANNPVPAAPLWEAPVPAPPALAIIPASPKASPSARGQQSIQVLTVTRKSKGQGERTSQALPVPAAEGLSLQPLHGWAF